MRKPYLFLFFLVLCGLRAADAPPAGFPDHRYRLQASDRIMLTYRYSPEYNESLIVQPDGYVSIQLIGNVGVEGKTVDEARAAILKQLQTRLNNPEVTLTLQDFVRPYFTIAGQVGSPGRYEIRGHTDALEAIAIAGGFKDNGKQSQVILFRRISPELAETHVLNIKRLTKASHPHLEENVNVEPGDVLVVPKTFVSKVADYVHWISVGSYIPLS
jgi:polysaccharide export outer membrane protein